MTEHKILRLGHHGDGIAEGPLYAPVTLPDEVVITAKQTHKCTEDGVIEIPKRDRVNKLLSVKQIPANKGLDHKLRSKLRKKEASSIKDSIEFLKADLKKLQDELKAIEPLEKK